MVVEFYRGPRHGERTHIAICAQRRRLMLAPVLAIGMVVGNPDGDGVDQWDGFRIDALYYNTKTNLVTATMRVQPDDEAVNIEQHRYWRSKGWM